MQHKEEAKSNLETRPSRRNTDDIGPGAFERRPQYVVMVEAGYPSHVPVVGLKPRRLEPEKAEKTFSVQGADEDIVNGLKDWAKSRGYTIKSTFELAVTEFLARHR